MDQDDRGACDVDPTAPRGRIGGNLDPAHAQTADPGDVRNCHLLFINKENPRDVLTELSGNAILTVGDRENFVRSGGMIGFYLDKNKIRFYINTKTARAANIDISSKLLRLANVIEE